MKTIAIVEDDRLLNEALSRMLSGAGYRVLRGYALRDGITLIYEDPDLMIIDIGLPDGEGTEICRRAGDYSRIPVLFERECCHLGKLIVRPQFHDNMIERIICKKIKSLCLCIKA